MLKEIDKSKLNNFLIVWLLVSLTLLLLVEAILSLSWPMALDGPLLHYAAFLIDRYNYVVYKDIFETSMPGTFIFHLMLTKLFGYSAAGFRVADLLWLALLSMVTWGFMRRLGWQVAWCAVILFGISYYQHGPAISLQRDYVGILPIMLAVLLVNPQKNTGFYLRGGLIGFLFGLAATIKPHLAIGLPWVLFILWRQFTKGDSPPVKPAYRIAAMEAIAAISGFILPILGVMVWLLRQGALSYFWEMTFSYLPLHISLTGGHQTIFGFDRIMYLIKSYKNLGGMQVWLLPAGMGFFLAFFKSGQSPEEKNIVHLLAGLTLLFSLYPILAGQFWPYHWMPFQYFVVLSASLLLVRVQKRQQAKSTFCILILGVSVFFAMDVPINFSGKLRDNENIYPLPVRAGGRAEEIAGFLKKRLRPGDRVQALDWTGGAVHAMLLSESQAATPFIYDYHFYHHISHPYIQILRQRFILKLKQVSPRFIINVYGYNKPWVTGEDTTKEFPALRDVLRREYSPLMGGNGYVIYEKIG